MATRGHFTACLLACFTAWEAVGDGYGLNLDLKLT